MKASSVPATEPEVSEEVLRVRYNGKSDQRILTLREFSGSANDPPWGVLWTPGAEVPMLVFEALAGNEDQAREVLRAHMHEFELVGPGADDFWAGDYEADEEFSIGGPVE